MATRDSAEEDLPCADYKLLVPLKRSADYRQIRSRVADPKPTDSWQQEGLHLFVFRLKPVDGTPTAGGDPAVVFTMHPEVLAPLSVVVVTPSADGSDAEVVDLRSPEKSYKAPLAPTGPAAPPPDGTDAWEIPASPVGRVTVLP